MHYGPLSYFALGQIYRLKLRMRIPKPIRRGRRTVALLPAPPAPAVGQPLLIVIS